MEATPTNATLATDDSSISQLHEYLTTASVTSYVDENTCTDYSQLILQDAFVISYAGTYLSVNVATSYLYAPDELVKVIVIDTDCGTCMGDSWITATVQDGGSVKINIPRDVALVACPAYIYLFREQV